MDTGDPFASDDDILKPAQIAPQTRSPTLPTSTSTVKITYNHSLALASLPRSTFVFTSAFIGLTFLPAGLYLIGHLKKDAVSRLQFSLAGGYLGVATSFLVLDYYSVPLACLVCMVLMGVSTAISVHDSASIRYREVVFLSAVSLTLAVTIELLVCAFWRDSLGFAGIVNFIMPLTQRWTFSFARAPFLIGLAYYIFFVLRRHTKSGGKYAVEYRACTISFLASYLVLGGLAAGLDCFIEFHSMLSPLQFFGLPSLFYFGNNETWLTLIVWVSVFCACYSWRMLPLKFFLTGSARLSETIQLIQPKLEDRWVRSFSSHHPQGQDDDDEDIDLED